MQRRKTGSRIAALFLSVFMLIACMPLLGDAVYADTTWNNVSAEEWGFSLKTDKAVYREGDDIAFCIEGFANTGKGPDTLWLGLYEYGASDGYTTSITWAYINGDSETTLQSFLNYNDLEPKKYHLIATTAGGGNDPSGIWATLDFTVEEAPVWNNVSSEEWGFYLKTDKATYDEGDDIAFCMEGFANTGKGPDTLWLGLYEYGASDGYTTSITWAYINGDSETTLQSFLNYNDFEPKKYHLIATTAGGGNDPSGIWATLDFTIESSSPVVDPDLETDKDTYNVDETIKVTASGGQWVGLYAKNETPKDIEQYYCYFSTNGNAGVKGEFTASAMERTLKAGQYKVVLFGDSGYENILLDKEITVEGSYPEPSEDGYELRLASANDTHRMNSNVEFEGGFCEGSAVTFEATVPASDTKAWIALYQYYEKNSYSNPGFGWSYVENGTASISSLKAAGYYKAVLFKEDGYTPTDVVYFYILPHNYNLTKVDGVPATCTDSGTAEYWKCTCGELMSANASGSEPISEPVTINALGHQMTEHAAVAETCVADGNSAYWSCDRCNKYFSDEKGDNEINENDWVIAAKHIPAAHAEVPATCEKAGTKAYWTCSRCEKMFADEDCTAEITEPETIPATGHKYALTGWNWETDHSAATATFTCSNDTSHVEKVSAKIVEDVVKAPKCEIDGESDFTATVTFDNKEYSDTEAGIAVPATGHTPDSAVKEKEVAATCITEGSYDEVVYCKDCKTELSRTNKTTGKAAHKLTKVDAKEATTEAEGNIEYWTCSVCKKYFSDAEGKTEITQDETVIPKKDEQKPDGPTDAEKAIAAAKEALNKLIEKAKEYVKAKYTEETFKVLQDAVAEAEVLVKDSKATAEELNEAASKLSDAMENLKEIEESIPDTDTAVAAAKEALNKAVENAKKVAKDKYTEASYKALENAIAEAEALAESGKATAEQLKAAGAKIADAINGLKEKEEATPGQTDEEKAAAAAKEDLNKAVTDAKAIEQGVYTDESYKALQDAIAEAEALEADPKATAEQLKAAAAKIEDAKNGLAVIADAAEEYGKDGTAVGPGASAEAADAAIKSLPNDNDPAGAKFAPLKLRSSKQGKTYITLNWTKSKKAVKYVIYGNACGKANKFKKLKTVKGSSSKITKITKKLKKAKSYKFLVVALDSNNKVVSTSKVIHVCTKGKANYTKVTTKAKNNKVSLKKGKTFKLGAKAVGKNVKKHVGIRYESSNKKVATVNKSGKITAKKKGTCKIYAYAQNGVRKIIKVTVK